VYHKVLFIKEEEDQSLADFD